MPYSVIDKTIIYTATFIRQNYSVEESAFIENEMFGILGKKFPKYNVCTENLTYESIQKFLSSINEKEANRKEKGVYYTPHDIVEFLIVNATKHLYGKLKENNLHVMDLNGIPYRSFCFDKKVFDPTCGAGEFLLVALETKLDLLDLHFQVITKSHVKKAVSSIYGNDSNPDSTAITKLRLFLCVLKRYGVGKIKGLASVMQPNFENVDYVTNARKSNGIFDLIVGNPPYVEDSKSGLLPEMKYGNIYANVLDNSLQHLTEHGVISYVIPLSYVSTPRMRKIRSVLQHSLSEQFILSFADRPDCLFSSVHQKLCLLFGKKKENALRSDVYTGNYRYWYKNERSELFTSICAIKNKHCEDAFIPKIGSKEDDAIYSKIKKNKLSLADLVSDGSASLSVNMRACFWIKAFSTIHDGAEYKELHFDNKSDAAYAFCLLNSSLFWWYWICVSDCWHITSKEFSGFHVPEQFDTQKVLKLAKNLEKKLEETKKYIGSVQTEYEYKHKECLREIRSIDNYINSLFRLTPEESIYISNFAFRYRISGGSNDSN